jgi:hypothetical protein
VVRHERWCQIRNPLVAYAFQVLADPSRLSLRDQLILHALGVSWYDPQCEEKTVGATILGHAPDQRRR